MSWTEPSTGDSSAAYDTPIVAISFYTDDPDEPIAGFGEQARLPVPERGERVRLVSEDLDAEIDGDEREFRVTDRTFEYRSVDYDGFSGEGRRQVIVVANVEVEPVRAG